MACRDHIWYRLGLIRPVPLLVVLETVPETRARCPDLITRCPPEVERRFAAVAHCFENARTHAELWQATFNAAHHLTSTYFPPTAGNVVHSRGPLTSATKTADGRNIQPEDTFLFEIKNTRLGEKTHAFVLAINADLRDRVIWLPVTERAEEETRARIGEQEYMFMLFVRNDVVLGECKKRSSE